MLRHNKSSKLAVLILLLTAALALTAEAAEVEPGFVLDSSTAVYEGANQTYLIPPPANFKLITYGAASDGYSLAFIPDKEDYSSATTIIGVTIYKLADLGFDDIVAADSVGLREFYGPSLVIRPVDSVLNFAGEIVPTFFMSDPERFIPTVELSYYDGGQEILIFELVISEEGLPRFMAEALYDECIGYFKVMRNRKLADN